MCWVGVMDLCSSPCTIFGGNLPPFPRASSETLQPWAPDCIPLKRPTNPTIVEPEKTVSPAVWKSTSINSFLRIGGMFQSIFRPCVIEPSGVLATSEVHKPVVLAVRYLGGD